MKRVMVLLPTLDEAEGITEVVPRIPHSALEASGWDVQVLVVDGGSDDGTIKIAEALGCSTLQQHGKGKGCQDKRASQNRADESSQRKESDPNS